MTEVNAFDTSYNIAENVVLSEELERPQNHLHKDNYYVTETL